MSNVPVFYVYILRRADGTPAYVGKGLGKRCEWHNKVGVKHPNPILARIFAKQGPFIVDKVLDGVPEDVALAHERDIIRTLGRRDNGTGILANLTDGGDGVSGLVVSAETREKLRAKSTGRVYSTATRAKIGERHRNKSISERHKEQLREYRSGRKASNETRAKMRESYAQRYCYVSPAAPPWLKEHP